MRLNFCKDVWGGVRDGDWWLLALPLEGQDQRGQIFFDRQTHHRVFSHYRPIYIVRVI